MLGNPNDQEYYEKQRKQLYKEYRARYNKVARRHSPSLYNEDGTLTKSAKKRWDKALKLAHRDTEGVVECFYCGDKLTISSLTFDHIIPKSKGGSNRVDNKCNCCKPCNERKADNMLVFGQFVGADYREVCQCSHPGQYCEVCSGR